MGRLNAEKTRAAVKYAGSRPLRALLRDIPDVIKSGSVLVLDVSFKDMVLSDLPGYAELLTTVDKTADCWRRALESARRFHRRFGLFHP